MISIIMIVIVGLFQSHSDIMEVKGTKDIYYRVFVNNKNFYFI